MKQGTFIFLLLTVLISGQLANANGGGYNFGIEETGLAPSFLLRESIPTLQRISRNGEVKKERWFGQKVVRVVESENGCC